MPENRRHRGPHPLDRRLFAPEHWPRLRAAVADLSWLLSRGYADNSAVKIVGDRYALNRRQRSAVTRSACSDQALDRRRAREAAPGELAGARLVIDGFNVITTTEAALAGGVLLRARDGCLRDLASMHGSYRKVSETSAALALIGTTLAGLGAGACHWLLDQPVSNSGRLKTVIRQQAAAHGWPWQVDLVADPDKPLAAAADLVATADSVILDRCRRWFNLGWQVVRQQVPAAKIVDLRDGAGT